MCFLVKNFVLGFKPKGGGDGKIEMAMCIQEEINKELRPGEVNERRFWLLIELSPFRIEKIICALWDFLVIGYDRREACRKHGASYSYFSIALKRLVYINGVVCQLTC